MKKAPKFTARFLKAYETANRANANWKTAQARLAHLSEAERARVEFPGGIA